MPRAALALPLALGRRQPRRAKRLARAPQLQYPKDAEKFYAVFLQGQVRRLHDFTMARLVPAYREFAAEHTPATAPASPETGSGRQDARCTLRPPGSRQGTAQEARADADARSLLRLLHGVRIEWERVSEASGQLDLPLAQVGKSISDVGKQGLTEQVHSVLGINPLFRDTRLASRLARFRRENVQLIKSISDKYFAQVGAVVQRGVDAGTRPEVMADLFEERYGVTRSRANLIARDQTAKLHSDLNQMRQEDLGVRSYTWRTSLDERVRPDAGAIKRGADPDDEATSHRAREGRIYRWDEPPGDPADPAAGGHPGRAINCRCWSEPNLAELLDSLESGEPVEEGATEPSEGEAEQEQER